MTESELIADLNSKCGTKGGIIDGTKTDQETHAVSGTSIVRVSASVFVHGEDRDGTEIGNFRSAGWFVYDRGGASEEAFYQDSGFLSQVENNPTGSTLKAINGIKGNNRLEDRIKGALSELVEKIGNGTINNDRAEEVAISDGGSSYQEGDVVTVSGGTAGTPTTVEVTEVSSGAITAARIKEFGEYTTPPSNPASVTGGNGSNAKLTLKWGNSHMRRVARLYNEKPELVVGLFMDLACTNGTVQSTGGKVTDTQIRNAMTNGFLDKVAKMLEVDSDRVPELIGTE